MRFLMWLAIGFGCACVLGVWVLPVVWIIPCAFVFAALVVLCGILRGRRPAILCLGTCLGLLWYAAFFHVYLLPARMMDGAKLETTFTATGYSYETDYGVGVDGEFVLEGRTYQVRLYVKDSHTISPGDSISGTFLLRYTAPGGREEPTYHAGERILLLGYQRGNVDVFESMVEGFFSFAAEVAYGIGERVERVFPEDVTAVVKAVLLGDDSELSYSQDSALKISGIRHIIAVSGLHVAILYTILRTVTMNRRFLTALLGIPVLVLFAAVAGFTPSVTRACMMVGLMMLSQLFNREYDPPTALSFAALAMMVWNPLIITSVSFQMSVACVTGILWFNEPVSDWLKQVLGNPKGKSLSAKCRRWLISSVSITLSATCLTMPMSAYYFGTVSLIGVLTNLLTLWAVQWIFIGTVIALVTSLILPGISAILGWCIGWLVRYVMGVAELLSQLPLAALYTQSIYLVVWLVFAYLLLICFVWAKGRYPKVFASIAVLGLCVSLLASWVEPLLWDTHMTVLDVGQGQSIILHHSGKTFLIDCGGSNDEISADAAAETLLSRGITRLDGIILTHTDRDHAGGIPYLLSRIDADFIMIPSTTDSETTERLSGIFSGELILVEEDLQVILQSGKISIFGPTFGEGRNENSLCVLLEDEKCAILVTGDRSYLGEKMLLVEQELPVVDVLIAGHHGSKYATSEELLQAVQPEIVIVSAGEGNSYGHPAPETLDRLISFGCRIFRTDQNGNIVFRR